MLNIEKEYSGDGQREGVPHGEDTVGWKGTLLKMAVC